MYRAMLEERARCPRIGQIASQVQGFSSIKVMAALNAALRVSSGGYLEVGLMHGKTLLGAMVGNEDRLFVGVDNFSQFGAKPEILTGNIASMFPQVDFRLHALDYREFFERWAGSYENQISVYFYDGDHHYEHQKRGLQLGVESGVLTPEAFIIVDDYSWEEPKRAMTEFLRERPEWSLILSEEDDWDQRGWWNGLAVAYRSMIS